VSGGRWKAELRTLNFERRRLNPEDRSLAVELQEAGVEGV
jgi:hypothetical protein